MKAGATDPFTFGRIYCPGYFADATPPFHHTLMAVVREAAATHRGVILGAPRNHGKSTLFSFLYPLWCAVYRRRRFIVILSASGTQAMLFADAIKKELEQNAQIQADFGSLVGADYGLQWSAEDLLITHPQRNADGTAATDGRGHPVPGDAVRLVSRGSGASVRGLRSRAFRPDLVIADDLETDEHVGTAAQRQKLQAWWYRAVEPMIDPRVGQVVVIGTILHHDSLLAHLLGRDDVYTTQIYRAIQDDGTALWPAKWPLEELARMRERIGSLHFAQEYLNEPLDPASQVFHPDWWRWWTRDDVTWDAGADTWTFGGAPLTIYAAFDPALGRGGDECALAVIGVTSDHRCVVLAMDHGQWEFPEQVARLKRAAADWAPRVVGIEAVAYQEALVQHVRADLGVPVRAIKHGHGQGKDAVVGRLTALSPWVESGRVLLRAATETEPGVTIPEIGIKVHATQAGLFEQASQYPASAHDDRLDALEMAIDTARVRRFFETRSF